MYGKYEIDREALGKMDVSVAITMTLDEWGELVEELGGITGGGLHGQLTGVIRELRRTHDDAARGRYTSTPYRTDAE